MLSLDKVRSFYFWPGKMYFSDDWIEYALIVMDEYMDSLLGWTF